MEDRYGLPLTTASLRAVDAYVEGVDRLLSAQPGATAASRWRSAPTRTSRSRTSPSPARNSSACSRPRRGPPPAGRARCCGVTDRERGHVEAIARAIDGDAAGALAAVKAHCADVPRDALVLQLNFGAFGLISFAGRREHDEEIYDFFRPFVGEYDDDWWFRFAWAWAHTESGRLAEGRRLMEQAFALNPRNANAVHGLAHVFYEQGDAAGGVTFVSGWLPGYDRSASLHCHLNWHVALSELVRDEAASRHKSEFLANMSHELRTPLNAILGFSEVLAERMFGEVNAKQAEYLQDILSSGRHLLSLINDILDLAKVEAGRLELELGQFDLPTALDNALTLVRERATRHGITLTQAMDPRVGDIVADERKVKQILLNLLSNAVKFTPEGGRVALTSTVADGAVTISVSDTGVGIAPEDQAAIFEEFRQVGRDDARKQEGTGLGLTLAKKFVELQGGRIWVESQVGQGSTFSFTLPVQPDGRSSSDHDGGMLPPQ